ncbi:MAG TPA: hypothetical protein VFZ89_04295, partial [Solirubrobacteraceae bacterium]
MRRLAAVTTTTGMLAFAAVAAAQSGTPTTGHDAIVGTDAPETIAALAGDDFVWARGGDDHV